MQPTSVSTNNKINHTFLDRMALESLDEDLEGERRAAEGENSVSDHGASTSTEDEESSSGVSTKGSMQDFEADLRRKILREEERNVRRARILVGIAFIACAATITCTVYFLTKQSDQYAFETEVRLPHLCF